MATLLEQLQQRLGQQAAPTVSAGPNIAEILKAKKGKAGTTTAGIASTSLAPELAAEQAKVDLQQQQQAGQMQGIALANKAADVEQQGQLAQEKLEATGRMAEQNLASTAATNRAATTASEQLEMQKIQASKEAKIKEMNNNAILAAQKMASERGLTLDNIFADVKQENTILAARKDAAQLEQKAAVLAWSDAAYMNELRRIGQQRNLTDEIEFDKAAKELAFGKDLNNKLLSMEFQLGRDAQDRDIRDQIAKLSNYEIIDLANSVAKQAMLEAQYKAGGDIVRAGINYYGKEEK